MDEMLKVMIAGIMRDLEERKKAKAGPLSWEEVMSAFVQNNLVEPVLPDGTIDRADKYFAKGTDLLKFDASRNDAVAKEVS